MELEQARSRVEELRAVIEKNNRLYYDQDAPELEDYEYDALTRELKALEALEKVADGKATKIIIPSEIQGLAGLAEGIIQAVKPVEQTVEKQEKK